MQAVVIGAGVVGLASARALALAGCDVIVLEAADIIGSGTSSRNSEVVHGGMYYPTGTGKARFCVEGRRMLYAFCESHGVPHRKCGKLIVATSDAETAKIEQIAALGLKNGVEGLEMLTGAAAREAEPALTCTAALWSPETGIVDSHAFMLALQGDLEAAGARSPSRRRSSPSSAPAAPGASPSADGSRARSRRTSSSMPQVSRPGRRPRRSTAIRRRASRSAASPRAITSLAPASPPSAG